MEIKIPGLTLRLEVVLASMVLGFIIALFTLRSCSKVSLKEGMAVMSTIYNLGDEGHSVHKSTPTDVDADESPMMSKWISDAHSYAQTMGDGYQTVLDRVKGNVGTKVPLENTMVFYKDNEFKPECCPSTYSSSTGCMCMSPEQVKHLAARGGNRSHGDEF
jgi:hypothetical protein